MKNLLLILLSIAFSGNVFAQQTAIFNTTDLAVYNAVKSSKDSMYNFTFVYPDGKLGTIIKNGKIATIVNPDGTNTVVSQTGNTSTVVNSNGAHSLWVDNGATVTIVNPNSTH